jgi:hypothetical protein
MGLTPKQDEFRAFLSVDGINSYVKTNDNCGYDMTLRGAAELNEIIKLVPATTYYSYTGRASNTTAVGTIACTNP